VGFVQDLAQAQAIGSLESDSPILLERYFNRVREINDSYKPWKSGAFPKNVSE